MKRDDIINNLLRTYQKHGVTRELIEAEIDSGLQQGFGYQTIYTGLRMAMGNCFDEPEHFTVGEMAEALGETPEEISRQIEELREQAAARGEDPDQYAVPVRQRFLIPPGALN